MSDDAEGPTDGALKRVIRDVLAHPVAGTVLALAWGLSIASWFGLDLQGLMLDGRPLWAQSPQLVTSTLLHADLLHLLFNSYWFLLFTGWMEGHARQCRDRAAVRDLVLPLHRADSGRHLPDRQCRARRRRGLWRALRLGVAARIPQHWTRGRDRGGQRRRPVGREYAASLAQSLDLLRPVPGVRSVASPGARRHGRGGAVAPPCDSPRRAQRRGLDRARRGAVDPGPPR